MGSRYCFKKDPNVTLLIEQEAEAVGRNEKQVRARDQGDDRGPPGRAPQRHRLARERRRHPRPRPVVPGRLPAAGIRRQAAEPAGDGRQGPAGEVRGEAARLSATGWAWPSRPATGRNPAPRRALPDRRRGREGEGQATQPDRRAEGPAPRARIDRAGRRRVGAA